MIRGYFNHFTLVFVGTVWMSIKMTFKMSSGCRSFLSASVFCGGGVSLPMSEYSFLFIGASANSKSNFFFFVSLSF